MTIKLTLIKILNFLFILLVLCCISLLNYCLMQVFEAWLLPLTFIPIFLASTLGRKLPIILLLFVGILDDIFTNGFLGLYPALYISMEYCISEKLADYRTNKFFILSFFMLFFGINVLSLVREMLQFW